MIIATRATSPRMKKKVRLLEFRANSAQQFFTFWRAIFKRRPAARQTSLPLNPTFSTYDYNAPLPNISTSCSPVNVIWGPQKPNPGKCRKIPGHSGFPMKDYSNAKKKADPRNSGTFILGIPNGHFGMMLLGG